MRLNDDLIAEAQRFARAQGITFTSVLDQALRELLRRRAQPAPHSPVRLPTFQGAGLQPGVDLDDTASLLERMERADGADRR